MKKTRQTAMGGALATATLLVMALGLAHTAAADASGGLERFSGHYVYSKSTEHGEQVVERAVEGALAELNMAKRAMVVAMMKRRSPLIKKVNIYAEGDTIKMKLDEFYGEAKLNKPTPIKNPQGKDAKLLYRFKDGKLQQIMKSDRGSISTVYKLEADGNTLQRYVTIKSDRLSKPIRFKLTYRRE